MPWRRRWEEVNRSLPLLPGAEPCPHVGCLRRRIRATARRKFLVGVPGLEKGGRGLEDRGFVVGGSIQRELGRPSLTSQVPWACDMSEGWHVLVLAEA